MTAEKIASPHEQYVGPMNGVRVLEMTQVIAGPFAGVIFADLGADVIKVERPDGGDPARVTGEKYKQTDDALTFLDLNRGKKSVTLDLKDKRDLEKFRRLASEADIFIHNQRPGVMEMLGLGADTLCMEFPRLIYCELTAFGHKGPMRLTPGYEATAQAFSGLSSVNGFPEMPPVRTGPSICDLGTGMWTAIGALAALRRRDVTGRGGVVHSSLTETALAWTAASAIAFMNTGVEPKRPGSGFRYMVPYQTFQAADGDLVICAGNDNLFGRMCQVLEHPEWSSDPKFLTNRDRITNRMEIVRLVQSAVASRSRADLFASLSAAGVPCSPVNSVPEAFADPHVEALEIVQEVPEGDMKLVALPFSIDRVRPQILAAAPRLGQHNDLLEQQDGKANV